MPTNLQLKSQNDNGITSLIMSRSTLPAPHAENSVTICVTDILGDNYCVVCEDGKRVYEHIARAFLAGKHVCLSFKNGEEISSAFLAEVFLRLYTSFSETRIENSLSLVDVDPEDAADIACVIHDVKDYLKDPQRFREAIIEVMGDDLE